MLLRLAQDSPSLVPIMPGKSLEELRTLLCDLQDHLREIICTARDGDSSGKLAGVADVTPADTIYEVDKISEAAISEWFRRHWPREVPVELVMEGAEAHGPLTFPEGTAVKDTAWKCILDPIDGTRNLMYDKRSAWALAGLAPQRGDATHLGDIVVAAMTELPTSKEWRSDQFSAIRGQGMTCKAYDVRTQTFAFLQPRPSTAADCRHGFAAITRFFPDGLGLLGELEERLWSRLYPEAPGGTPLVFNDQYLTTGGQLVELVVGHDRFIADLRPLVFRKLGLDGSLSSHPYDLAGVLVAEEAGVIVEDPLTGEPLASPLDTTTPVAWAGYANAEIAAHVRPQLQALIQEML
jgi:fructose-1,6-bisphosphatase/inositol monophosphatase family enzyme